jgi:prefoldin alpha subunit
MIDDRMAEKEEELEKLRYMHDMYSREYEVLLNEISNYVLVSNSFERNKEVLENMESIKNANLLLNLEAGTFIEINSKDIKKVMTSVGAGYLVEKDVEGAKIFVNQNSDKVQETLRQLISQRQRLEKELIDLAYKIGALQQA